MCSRNKKVGMAGAAWVKGRLVENERASRVSGCVGLRLRIFRLCWRSSLQTSRKEQGESCVLRILNKILVTKARI